MSEFFYQHLKRVVYTEKAKKEDESVHFLSIPVPREEIIDTDKEKAVRRMQSVIELGRLGRDRRTLPVKVCT